MNRRYRPFLLCALFFLPLATGILLRGQLASGPTGNIRGAVLSACSGSTMLFDRQIAGNVDRWAVTYHSTVGKVVDDVLEKTANPVCTVKRTEDVPASLTTLARKLAPWQGSTPVRLSDTPAVLLETLRVYECSLREWNLFLSVNTTGYENTPPVTGGSSYQNRRISIVAATKNVSTDRLKIEQELAVARPALNKTLTYLGAALRLSPLSQNMDCLVRASTDMRNVLGLAAETSMCLPRGWDVSGTLKNLSPTNN